MATKAILAVAEDGDLRDIIRLLLEEELHLPVLTATGGAEALRMARDTAPGLVLLDWVDWPLTTRPEDAALVRALSGDPSTSHVPVLALAFSAEGGHEAVAAGCTDWIEKPFDDIDVAIAKIRAHLDGHQALRERAVAD